MIQIGSWRPRNSLLAMVKKPAGMPSKMFRPPCVMRSSIPSMIVPAPSVITKAETFDQATIPPITAPTAAPSSSVRTSVTPVERPTFASRTIATAPMSWVL